ncbi:uncharacterized protein [Lolium perenne]|uniref:uncharacterized protein n=1 Tax=Lolium perenne TaxID=4522 RepID=UPI003A9A169C
MGNPKEVAVKRGKNKEDVKWDPPPQGWIKVTVDGSFLQEHERGTTGAVIRDHLGKIIVDAGNTIPRCNSVEEAEAFALLEGAKLAKEWTNGLVIFESDCIQVVNAVHQGRESLSNLRSILSDFVVEASCCQQWICIHVKRGENVVAHECDAYVQQVGGRYVWDLLFPERVTKAYALDSNRILSVD